MKKKQKMCVLLCSLVLILALTIGATIAFLKTKTESVTNTFAEASVTTEVVESFDGNVKSDVKIKNTGTIDAYIRAAVVVTWQDEAGNVLGTVPVEGTNYSMKWTLDDWFKGDDGFYYYKNPVAPGTSTKVLFTECKPKGDVPEAGYYLNVEIIASGIQAEPASVVESVWEVETEASGNQVVVLKSK